MKKGLAYLVAFALAAFPAAASADLSYDDGSFETSTALELDAAPAVQFDAPGAGVYALDSVSFLLQEAVPGEAPLGLYPVTVQIWDDTPAAVATIGREVDFVGNARYTLDLTREKLAFTNTVRVGIFLRYDPLVPAPGIVSLGVDTTISPATPFGHSYVYDTTIVPPADPWIPDTAANYGIQASVREVPSLTCQGFLPPLNRTRTMKRGGRTLPLKAFLFDDAGAAVTRSLLASPPLVQLLYSSGEGVDPIDVTDLVAPAGRSNKGQAFRSTGKGRWIYNLKTKKSFPAGTYSVLVGSGDRTEYVVDPTCTGTFVIEAPKPKKQKK